MKKHLNWKSLSILIIVVIIFLVAFFYTDVLPPLRNEQPAVTQAEEKPGQIKGAQTEEKDEANPVPAPASPPSAGSTSTKNGSINVAELCKQAVNYQKFYESLPWTPENYDNQIAKKTYDELCGTGEERIKATPENPGAHSTQNNGLQRGMDSIEKSVERAFNRVF